jgi:hypothetical protein
MSKNKGIKRDNCIKYMEENIKDGHIRNACKGVGYLKGGFKHYTNICRGITVETIQYILKKI